MMFDELDQLKKLTTAIALEAEEKPVMNDDLGAEIIDGTMDSSKYENGNPVFYAKIKGSDDMQYTGSSGTPSPKRSKTYPIFEKKEGEPATQAEVDEALSLGLGAGIGNSLKRGLNLAESCEGTCCDNPMNVGDCICMKEGTGPKVILIIKNCDGHNLTAARPTANPDDFTEDDEGCWPVIMCDQDDVSPMSDVSLDDIFDILRYNDAQLESFGSKCTDDEPMNTAQDVADNNQRDIKLDELKEKLEDMFGTIRQYDSSKPAVEIKKPDGVNESSKKFGTWGSSDMEF